MHRDKCGAAAIAGLFGTLEKLRPSGVKVVGKVVNGKWDGDFGEWVYEIEVPRKTRGGGTYVLRNCDEGSLRITTLAPTGLEQEDDEEEIARRPRRTTSIFTR